MKYLFIFEDGNYSQSDELTKDELNAADDGYLDIIDTTEMTTYYQCKWTQVPIK